MTTISPDAPMPGLRELGLDLLRISPLRRMLVILAPFLCLAAYGLFAVTGFWPLAIIALMAISFFTYGSTSHDLVHRNLHLPPWLSEFLLCLIELLALRSGHAYRAAHLHHHARFPHSDDIEGAAARKSLIGALADGLTLQERIWFWALRRVGCARGWLIVEGIFALGIVAAAIAVSDVTAVPLVYVVVMLLGHAVLPVVTVYFVHDAEASNRLLQTRVFRGRGFSIIALEHLYHLEHHLYPSVPHPNWPELARRLDPYFRHAGVPFHFLSGNSPLTSSPQYPSRPSAIRD